jgi:hypothetical protein
MADVLASGPIHVGVGAGTRLCFDLLEPLVFGTG